MLRQRKAQGTLEYNILKGYWTDAGTFESLFRATCLVAKKGGPA